MGRLWDKGQPLDALIEAYTVGDDPQLDQRLLPFDVEGSKAHARMLASIEVLDDAELSSLLGALDEALAVWKAGEFTISLSQEDVHTALEQFLTERVGDVGKKVHTGRSRNDQVLVDLALWQRDAVEQATRALHDTISSFEAFAAAHAEVPLPGYTHLQRAMPSTVARWSGAYASLLRRNLPLLEAAGAVVSHSPLGSAAGYGVPDVLGIDREQTAADLGFAGPILPAEAAQPGRGKAESTLLFALAQIATDLGKWAWDVCLYVTAEYGFFALPNEFTTGSSIMPQKRNPDVLELTRAKAAVVRSALTEVMAIAGPLPSGHHRDLQLPQRPLLHG
ncbi:MAG: argininosuccinate lyase, partial [Deltaproteobacteria bacterium]|nr:argininosuccinate lyase [Deltaproteobacteria bacterium]